MLFHVVRHFFDAVVPLRCAACGDYGYQICARCIARFSARGPLLRAARAGVPNIVALGSYEASLRSAILNIKFRHRHNAAIALGKILGAKIGWQPGAIVPVPLHGHRLRERGFNQAQAIAEGIAQVFEAPVVLDALVRERATEAQSSLPLSRRQSNVRNAFWVGTGVTKLGRNVLLVDDVVTTGATVAACAQVLHDWGVDCIDGAALAVRL